MVCFSVRVCPSYEATDSNSCARKEIFAVVVEDREEGRGKDDGRTVDANAKG